LVDSGVVTDEGTGGGDNSADERAGVHCKLERKSASLRGRTRGRILSEETGKRGDGGGGGGRRGFKSGNQIGHRSQWGKVTSWLPGWHSGKRRYGQQHPVRKCEDAELWSRDVFHGQRKKKKRGVILRNTVRSDYEGKELDRY